MVDAGRSDLARAVAGLAARIPEPLAPLAAIAYDYAWSWHPEGSALFAAVDAHRWAICGGNPVRLLQEAPWPALERAAADAALVARVAAVEAELRAARERPAAGEQTIAYLCAEYAVHASLPVYSGGLGALAGDLVKEAADRALPLVAVGLMYRQGYFRQRIDLAGWQREFWVETDPERLPAALVTGDDGAPLTVEVPIRDERVVVQIWRVDVGSVPLLLLDADRPENRPGARWTSARLYVGDPVIRLNQYALLGLGALRALRAVGVEPDLVHLNEGHGAFSVLEAPGATLADAVAAQRARTIFTTHTPVPAGNDAYPAEAVVELVRGALDERGFTAGEFVRLGRTHPDDAVEPFGITQLALRTSHRANGVSARHGEVARHMWRGLFKAHADADVPIGHVTNGVHVPTWIGAPMRALLDERLGAGWRERVAEPATWAPVDDLDDAALAAARRAQREALIALLRERTPGERFARGEELAYAEEGASAFDPDVLTIGFARRVATYKRLVLLVHDPQRALGLLHGRHPVQIVIAGKAHPHDEPAKRLIQQLLHLRGAAGIAHRVVFLADYDLASAAALVQGCDLWINVPRPPLEASGTSGMKSVLNGGLQLSVRDGWWAEAYDGANGWALDGAVDDDHVAQDARHADGLYALMEQEIVPAFYDDGGALWAERQRASLRTLAPRFSAARMLADYAATMYSPTP